MPLSNREDRYSILFRKEADLRQRIDMDQVLVSSWVVQFRIWIKINLGDIEKTDENLRNLIMDYCKSGKNKSWETTN